MERPIKRDNTTVLMAVVIALLIFVVHTSYCHFAVRYTLYKQDEAYRNLMEKNIGFKVSDQDWREFTKTSEKRYKFQPGSEDDPRTRMYRKWKNEKNSKDTK